MDTILFNINCKYTAGRQNYFIMCMDVEAKVKETCKHLKGKILKLGNPSLLSSDTDPVGFGILDLSTRLLFVSLLQQQLESRKKAEGLSGSCDRELTPQRFWSQAEGRKVKSLAC